MKKAKVTIRKYMGDDLYSWAVFVDGVPATTGCSRSEAQYHKKRIEELLAQKVTM